MKTRKKSAGKNAGGRPPKFREPRRPITITLPERTLKQLAVIDQDRARAIVKAADAACPPDATPGLRVKVTEVAPGVGAILVGPNRFLSRIPWLRLVEVAPARYLIAIPSGTPVDSLEIVIGDLMEGAAGMDSKDKALLEELQNLFRSIRRAKVVSKAEIVFVNTDQLARSSAS